MKDLTLKDMNKLEEEFTLNNYNGIKTEEESFKILEGSVPILLSAPHSIDQLREGTIKHRELFSGALCKLIQASTNCYAIYKYHNDEVDDNFILHTRYKEKIGKLIKEHNIKLVIDIHGMLGSTSDRYRGYDIELGTDNGRNLLGKTYISEEMKNILNKHGVEKVAIDKKFKASRECTIAKYVSKNFNTPAIQVEISGNFRNPLNYKLENVKKFLNAFIEIVKFSDRI